MRKPSARVVLGTANGRELEQLSVLLNMMREREAVGRPMLFPKMTRPLTERFNTRWIASQIRRANRGSRWGSLLALCAVVAFLATPLFFALVR